MSSGRDQSAATRAWVAAVSSGRASARSPAYQPGSSRSSRRTAARPEVEVLRTGPSAESLLVGAVGVLCLLGLVMVYSASSVASVQGGAFDFRRYDKRRLVPFGEYVPAGLRWLFPRKLTPGEADYAAGEGPPSVRLKMSYGTQRGSEPSTTERQTG